jgi:hypothetical protein
MVRLLRALNHSIKDLARSVVAHLDEHPDAVVFRSLPRAGQVSAGTGVPHLSLGQVIVVPRIRLAVAA